MRRDVLAIVIALLTLGITVDFAPGTQAQEEMFDLPILAVNCKRVPTVEGGQESIHAAFTPTGAAECDPGVGAAFTVADAETAEVYGSCVAEAGDGPDPVTANCTVQVPYGTTVVVTEDVATLPGDFAPLENPKTVPTPPEPIVGGIPPSAGFLNLRQDGTGRTLTIYKAFCPAGYTGDAYADDCSDTPGVGVSFRVGRPFTEAFTDFASTGGDGYVSFEIAGLPLDDILRVIEALPTGTQRFVVACTGETGEALEVTYVDYSASNPDIGVVDVAVGEEGDASCDWYNVPAAAPTAVEPTAPDNSVSGRPAHVHGGTCADHDPEPRFALTGVAPAAGEPHGSEGAIPAEASYTVLDIPLNDLLAEAHVITVHESEEALRNGEEASVVACGEIGGIRRSDGAVAIGLREQNDSGFVGIAYLAAVSENADRTQVSVFVAEAVAEKD